MFGGLGTQELLIFGVIAVLLFGKRLPEVAKSLGSSYREFRKGLTEVQRQMDVSRYLEDDKPGASQSAIDEQYVREPAVPKFEPPVAPADHQAGQSSSMDVGGESADRSAQGGASPLASSPEAECFPGSQESRVLP